MKYVDLDQVASGIGTEGDPFNATDFLTWGAGVDDNAKIKGDYRITGSVNFSGDSYTFQNWLADAPWRLSGSSYIDFSSVSLRNGIVQADGDLSLSSSTVSQDTSYFGCALMSNIRVVFSFYSDDASYGMTVRGATIKAPTVTNSGGGDYPGSIVYDDSVLIATTFNVEPGYMTLNKCAGSFATPAGITLNNCQFSWSAPSYPAWDAVRSAWLSTTLSVGINTPPQPGTSPYTDYATGLWGTARTGIGALDFPGAKISTFSSATVVDGATVTSTVDVGGTVTAIQASGTDTYFDSTSEVARVDVYYTHQDGRQNKRLVHQYPGFASGASWSSFARDGTWSKSRVRAFDWEGAKIDLDGTNVPSGENLTHTDGTMNLNT